MKYSFSAKSKYFTRPLAISLLAAVVLFTAGVPARALAAEECHLISASWLREAGASGESAQMQAGTVRMLLFGNSGCASLSASFNVYGETSLSKEQFALTGSIPSTFEPAMLAGIPAESIPSQASSVAVAEWAVPSSGIIAPSGETTGVFFIGNSPGGQSQKSDRFNVLNGDKNGVVLQASTAATQRAGESGTFSVVVQLIVGGISGVIRQVVFWLYSLLVVPFIATASQIHTGTGSCAGEAIGTGFLGIVCPGWHYVRNVMNMFFILALIIIGIATILRMETYNYKKLLGRLILAALLINFSLVIGQAILTFTDVLQNTFVGGTSRQTITNFGEVLMNKPTFSNDVQIVDLLTGRAATGGWTTVSMQLMDLSISLVTFVIMAFIAFTLMFRLVAIWVLLILSPAAYAFLVLPATRSYSSLWWSNFIKYAFFAPIMFFFINLALILQANVGTIFGMTSCELITGGNACAGDQATAAGMIFKLAQQFIILAMLFASLQVAKKASVAGADMAEKYARKAGMLPLVGAGAAAGAGYVYGKRKYDEGTSRLLEAKEGAAPPSRARKALFALAHLPTTIKTSRERTAQLSKNAHEDIKAGSQENVEQFWTRGKIKTPYRQFLERKRENELMKEYQSMSKERFMEEAIKMDKVKPGNAEYDRRKRAILKGAAANGYVDDLMSTQHFFNKYADKDGSFNTATATHRMLNGFLGRGEQADRLIDEDLEQLGKQTKHWEYVGHKQYNPKTGVYEDGMKSRGMVPSGRKDEKGEEIKIEDYDLENSHQPSYAAAEFNKLGGRDRVPIAPHSVIPRRAVRNAQGEFEFNDEGVVAHTTTGREDGSVSHSEKLLLSKLDMGALREFQHQQPRMKENVFGRLEDIIISDDQKGVQVKSEADYRRIKGLYEANKAWTLAQFGAAAGIKGPADNTFGFYVEYKDKDGNPVRPPAFGDPSRNKSEGGKKGEPAAPASSPPPPPSGRAAAGGTSSGGASPGPSSAAGSSASTASSGPGSATVRDQYKKYAEDPDHAARIHTPSQHYTEDIGAATVVEGMKGVHQDNEKLADRMQEIMNSYRKHASEAQASKPGLQPEAYHSHATKQVLAELKQQERDSINKLIQSTQKNYGVKGQMNVTDELALNDFLRKLGKIK